MFDGIQNIQMEKESTVQKVGKSLKKNWFNYLMGLFIVIMFTVPNAKAWLLQQAMVTGLFNASIDDQPKKAAEASALDFDFRDQEGNIVNTSSLRGKVVFINFWASWCPPCLAEFPSIQSFYEKNQQNADLYFLIVNEDNDPSVGKQFLAKEKYTLPFSTRSGGIPPEIFSGSLPTTIVLDKQGRIRMKHEGFANYDSTKFNEQIAQLIKE